MKRVVVIGCGASGMMAAIASAREGAQVTVLESGRKPGRKLLLTGNSRCNLTNMDPDIAGKYNSAEVSSVLDQFNPTDTIRLFKEFGLLTMKEHGTWVYPVTGRSESVLSVLLRELQRLHVKLKFNTEVIGIDRENKEWQVRTNGWSYPCDSVVLACGSRTVPSTGSNGSGYELCRGLGLEVTDILPALTAIQCRLEQEDDIRTFGNNSSERRPDPMLIASGIRINADVSVYTDGELAAKESGQVQFTQNGISGIVVFNMSRFTIRALHRGMDVRISLDLLPQYSEEELTGTLERLSELRPDDTVKDLLSGILPSGLVPLVTGDEILQEDGSLQRLSHRIKNIFLQASGVRDFDNCQVCAGGVSFAEIDPDSMECVREDLKGIHIAGELVDIDGPCGGYNLQWAWSSGYAAGKHAAAFTE